MFKKIASVCLASILMFNTCLAATGGPFKDVPADSDYAVALQYLKNKGIVNGYEDGTFHPERTINRAESVKMIMSIKDFKYWGNEKIADDNSYDAKPFKDVSDKNAWYYQYVKNGVNQGLITGYPDKTFRPNQQVIKVEGLKMLMEHTFMRIDRLTGVVLADENKPYDDIDLDAWYAPYVVYAADMGITTFAEGEELSGKFLPSEGLTRGSLANMIYNTLVADDSGKKPTVISQE